MTTTIIFVLFIILKTLSDVDSQLHGRRGILEETLSIVGNPLADIGKGLNDLLIENATGDSLNIIIPKVYGAATTTLNRIADAAQSPLPDFPPSAKVSNCSSFDYVVVGGGTAGCIVANRLSEDDNVTVLLIEAGGDPNIFSILPSLFPLLVFSDKDWQFRTVVDSFVSQSQIGDSSIMHVARHLGGGSSSSYSVYFRGKELTYKDWNVEGWDYDSNLPYFIKLENVQYEPITSNPDLRSIHGTEGPVDLTTHEGTEFDFIENLLLRSFESLGYDIIPDINDRTSLGFAKPLLQVAAKGIRSSTAIKYILPARNRTNLFILKNTFVNRLVFDSDGKTAVGVEFRNQDGKLQVVYARREVILTAGPYGTAKILMLSGVGPADHLQEVGIPVRVDSPVGLKYRDIPAPFLLITGTLGLTGVTQNVADVLNLNTFPIGLVSGFVSLEGNDNPQVLMIPLAFPAASPILPIGGGIDFNLDFDFVLRAVAVNVNNDIVNPFVVLTDLDSFGYVKLRSPDPDDPPIIFNGYYTNRTDLVKAIQAIKLAANLTTLPEFRSADAQIITLQNCDDKEYFSDEYFECMTLESTASLFLGFGSAPLGEVVDSRLNVIGLSRVRVMDSSVIPSLRGALPQAVTMMVAEKGSDFVKADRVDEQPIPMCRND